MSARQHAYFPKEEPAQPSADLPHVELPPASPTAWQFLHDAAHDIASRAQLRDQPTGERSMARTVAAFNAMFGEAIRAADGQLTEEQGWMFMELLKMSRGAAGNYHQDDHADRVSYAALAAEAAARDAANRASLEAA